MRYRITTTAGRLSLQTAPDPAAIVSFLHGAAIAGSFAVASSLSLDDPLQRITAAALLGGATALSAVDGWQVCAAIITDRAARQLIGEMATTQAQLTPPHATADDAGASVSWRVDGHTMTRIDAENRRAAALLRAALKVADKPDQLPRFDRIGWGRDASRAVIAGLRDHITVNPPGRARGTYITSAQYPTIEALLQALETGRVRPHPATPTPARD